MPATRTLPWLTVTVCIVGLAGCGRRDIGATAAGLVTIDGRAAPAGLRIDFQPDGPKGSPSTGITDDKGRYELWFTPGNKGVMPGECRVMVQCPPATGPDGPRQMTDALRSLQIPAAFAGDRSPLIRTVKPGHNTINIEIDTKSVPPGPKR